MKNALKIMLVALMMAFTTTASAINYNQARRQALFLADKMAYELNLSNRQYEAVYRINLDYLMAVNNRGDVFGNNWARRNYELKRMLSRWQYNKYIAANYFYRPVYWSNNNWRWRIYNRYSSDRWYYSRPSAYSTYRGGGNCYPRRSWRSPRNNCYSYSSSYSSSSCNDYYDYDDDDYCGYDCDYDDDDWDDYDDCDDWDGCNSSNYNSNYNSNSNYNNNVNVINLSNSVNSNYRPGFRFW